MFEIPPAKPVHELNALIIDQQALVRDTVKSALLGYGIKHIASTENAFEAVSACNKRRFDLFFIAFDLNSDKDGFHLLEELKFKGHIKNASCVVFLSADTGAELVNCVVEMQPDDFWKKPIDQRRVQMRLGFILTTKKALHRPLYCADRGEYSRAIYYADRLVKLPNLSPYKAQLHRLIGNCLCRLGEFKDAELFFRKLLKNYNANWVHIGLANCLLKQRKFTDAQLVIDELKLRNDTRCAIHDLMAKHFVEQEDFEQAYVEIQQAASLAPRNIERNKRCWDLARLNHDRQGQHLATTKMAKYAKNSIHDSPAMTLNLVRACLDLAGAMQGEQAEELLRRAEKQVVELQRQPDLAHALKNPLSVIAVRLLCARNDKHCAEAKLNAEVMVAVSNSLEDNLDLVKALHELGRREKALALLEQIKGQIAGDSFASHIVKKYLEQEIKERRDIHFTPKELGEMAAVYYKQRRLCPAFKSLHQAFQLSPTNPQLALSMLKVLAALSEQQALDRMQRKAAIDCMTLLRDLALNPEQRAKFLSYCQALTQIDEQQLLQTTLC